MSRVAGIDLPKRKRLEVALTYIYGVGPARSQEICKSLNLNPGMKTEELTEAQTAQLSSHIQTTYPVEGDLRREVQGNIKRLISINSYRGIRHKNSLPVRGQRTRTNARTRRGKRKTVTGKKVATKK